MFSVTSPGQQATRPEGRRVRTEPGSGGVGDRAGRVEGLCPNGRAELLSGILLEGAGINIWEVGVRMERLASSHPQPPAAFAGGGWGGTFAPALRLGSSSEAEGSLASSPSAPRHQRYLILSSVTNIELFFRSVNWDF